jgi:hypothetical protein
MKLSGINPGTIAILCATSFTIGIVSPAMTVTPPSQTIPTTKTTQLPKVIPPVKTTSPPKAIPITPANTVVAPQPTTTPNNPPLVAVPSLTATTLNSFTTLYGQVLAVKFTPNQQQKIQQRVSREWMTNLGLRNTVVQTIAMEPQILRGTPAELTQLQAKLVGNLRQQVLDGDADALWLVSFYDAVPKNWLAAGKPPLTQMTSDIST